jgi:hypothetical protein
MDPLPPTTFHLIPDILLRGPEFNGLPSCNEEPLAASAFNDPLCYLSHVLNVPARGDRFFCVNYRPNKGR